MTKEDKERMSKFKNCKCQEHDDFTHYRDYYECNLCGFKRSTDYILEKNSKKYSKSDS